MNKPMPIIDSDGKYVYVDNTRKLKTSDHPVYRARIELALGEGEWIAAPASGHRLGRFKRERRSQHKIEEFRKELEFYLQTYNPDVIDTLVTQGGVNFDLTIKQEALRELV